MKKAISSVLLVLFLFGLVSCKGETLPDRLDESGKPLIVATLFPQYDFARQIAGERAEIRLLLPPGADSHAYEPRPSDILLINNADLFIYTGKYMEVWAEKIIASVPAENNVVVCDVSEGITLSKNGEDEDETHNHEEAHDGHSHAFDPHIWTNPVYAKKMMQTILTSLCEIDPANATYYSKNAEEYGVELDMLDASFREIVSEGTRTKLYFGSPFTLHYFAEEYGLSAISAYGAAGEGAEPSVSAIAHMIEEMEAENAPVIFYAELSDPKVARTISEETGAEMLLFHSCHNVSKDEFEAGVTYLKLMQKNAEHLRKAMS